VNDPNLLDDFLDTSLDKRRRALLPWWMKICVWIFIVAGLFSLPVFVLGITKYNYEISLYGLVSNDPLSLISFFITLLFLYKGVVGYSLWMEKDWAVILAIIDALIGILICILTMFGILSDARREHSVIFRPEIVLLIIYLVKLIDIKSPWARSK
jgi:uncharacterized membrane protein